MVLIKRTDKRLAPRDAHLWFSKNPEIWGKLKEGVEIEIPENELETIKGIFRESIVVVEKKQSTILKNVTKKVEKEKTEEKKEVSE